MGKHTTTLATMKFLSVSLSALMGFMMSGCADMNVPDPRSISIPAPTPAEERQRALNESADSIMVVPLGKDVLTPQTRTGDPLPSDEIGPFELRNENLAGALQLILADYDIPLAFEAVDGAQEGVTVSNLRGPLDKVVGKVCSLADMYCLYEDGVLTVKRNQTFTVSLPPLPGEGDPYATISTGLQALTGGTATVDPTTRTLIYTATARTAKLADQFFERLRKNTAMIVYETYIWEVALKGSNNAGIKWSQLSDLGSFNTGITVDGGTGGLDDAISIGLPTRGAVNLSTGDILRFISTQGAVKTISQPQLTVLSGAEASLRVAETENYIESFTRTLGTTTTGDSVSTTTGQVDSGFTLTIGSSWDNGTVYGNIAINLQQFLGFEDFSTGTTGTGASATTNSLKLPRTSEREVNTQVRVRPGDSVLIAGLVRDRQTYETKGLGLNKPLVPTSRQGSTDNTELVFLLRPRVIIYKSISEIEKDKNDIALARAIPKGVAEIGEPKGVLSSEVDQPVPPLKKWEDEETESSPSVGVGMPVPNNKSSGKKSSDVEAEALSNGQSSQSDLPMGSLPSSLLDPSFSAAP